MQEPTREVQFKEDPFYDHHAEILKAKQELENEEAQQPDISDGEGHDMEAGDIVRESD